MNFSKGPVVTELKSPRNWIALLVLLSVTLLLYHDPFLLPWWPQAPAKNSVTRELPLDMAVDCIDDMYDGCRSETALVIDLFGVFEWHVNRNFSYAWASAEPRAKKPVHNLLKDDHAIVMYMYTKLKFIQQAFDEAVKTGKLFYSSYRFKFHYFYFYLVDAIQLLRGNETSCQTVYYRTWKQFDLNVINTNMRFGDFTWASSNKRSLESKDHVSCFEIHTCFGADITHYSAIAQMGQVLIPPYEAFRITDVLTTDPRCKVVYKLQSLKTPRRDLNCRLTSSQMKSYLGAVATQWQTTTVVRMSVCLFLLVLVSLVLVKRRQKCFVAAVLGTLLVLMIILALVNICG